MVIPSDITKWGFVRADLGEFEEIFNEGSYIDYKNHTWRLMLFNKNIIPGVKVVIFLDGGEVGWDYCNGPKDIFNLLIKVGYLNQIPTDANKENFTQ